MQEMNRRDCVQRQVNWLGIAGLLVISKHKLPSTPQPAQLPAPTLAPKHCLEEPPVTMRAPPSSS